MVLASRRWHAHDYQCWGRHESPSQSQRRGREAAEQALKRRVSLRQSSSSCSLYRHDQPSLVRTVREATGGAPLTGCSAEGTINEDDADESGFSVVVTAISSEELQWTNGIVPGLEDEPRAVGRQLAQDLLPNLSADAIGLFVFPDGLTDYLEPFLAGLEENLPSDRFLPMWGGGAGNNVGVEPTYQYCDDEVISGGVAYALLSGKAQASWAISHGLVPIGSARTVTRSQENVIYEIDGKPAIEVLKEYLPEQALVEDRDWMRYALSLALTAKAPNYMKDEEYVVRGVPAVRMADGSITVETEVPEGTSVWFSSRDKEKITSRVDRMARQITEQLGDDKPKLVFQFECFTRGKLLFREQEKCSSSSGFDNPLGRTCHGLVFTP